MTGRFPYPAYANGWFRVALSEEVAPDLAEVAVIGLPDRQRGERCCAVVVPRGGAVIDLEGIVRFCRERWRAFMRFGRAMAAMTPTSVTFGK